MHAGAAKAAREADVDIVWKGPLKKQDGTAAVSGALAMSLSEVETMNYLVQGGERNRGMSIIKSRGTAHSNQVRELILSDAGVTLADTYTAGGEVLMGTMRWEKESAERVAAEVAEVAAKLKKVQLDAEEAELEVRVKSLQTELVAKQVEKALLSSATASRQRELSRGRSEMAELRGADAAHPGRAP